ncbi:hypothetical protein BH11PSE2_BH11PSE2_04030 [soil metagenome]
MCAVVAKPIVVLIRMATTRHALAEQDRWRSAKLKAVGSDAA